MKTKSQQVIEQMPMLIHNKTKRIFLIGWVISLNITATVTAADPISANSEYGAEQSRNKLTELRQGYRKLAELTTQHISVRDAFHSGYMARFYASRANVIMCLMGSEDILKQAGSVSDPALQKHFVTNTAHQYLFDMQIIHNRIKMNDLLHSNANTEAAKQILEIARKQHLKLKSHYRSRLKRILGDKELLKELTSQEIKFATQQQIIR